jgi:hypothetical protein
LASFKLFSSHLPYQFVAFSLTKEGQQNSKSGYQIIQDLFSFKM